MELYRINWSRLAPGTQTQRDYYVEHTYSIPFRASYHDLARFLSDIGQMERIFATRFSQLAPGESSGGAITVSGDLTFLIYTSK